MPNYFHTFDTKDFKMSGLVFIYLYKEYFYKLTCLEINLSDPLPCLFQLI